MQEYIVYNEVDLLNLAKSLGRPVASRVNGNIVDNLTPLKAEHAHKQSLSANFGLDAFPFHTDGAYFPTPPRYIILRYLKGVENPTPTIVCDLSQIDCKSKLILKYTIWQVRSREGSFLSTILSQDDRFFRYDKCIMKPVISRNNNSTYFENLIADLPKTEIYWHPNKTVVLDNWAFMHSRPEVQNQEVNFRTIQRIMIT